MKPARQHGVAAVEFALLLPLLLIMLYGMIDLSRAVQANVIMVNVSREGANLVSRGNTQVETGSQEIIYALMASTPPLNVNQQGMVYITRVMGVVQNGVASSVVLDQYRWDDAKRNLGYRANGYLPASAAFACPAWNGAVCSGISSSNRPAVDIMKGKLADGEVVHVVETFYKFDMMLAAPVTTMLGLPVYGPDLTSLTVF
jgi:Flp pilus assembly protein TadG